MQTKQTIGIIGATGSMGSALARSLCHGPYRLLLFARDQQKLEALVSGIRNTAPDAEVDGIDCPVDAGWEADIIIAAVPYAAEKEVAGKIREVSTQKIIISLTNPLNPEQDAMLTPPGTSAAEELQQLLPYSKVIKAFNTNTAASFAQPVINGLQADVFLAGNDAEALDTVAKLAAVAGFRPLVAGPLAACRILESMPLLQSSVAHCNNLKPTGWKILYEQHI